MKNTRHPWLLEAVTVLLFLAFLFPFFIVLINSAKDAFQITVDPLSMPENWGQIGTNMVGIWTNTNIRYPASFKSSVIITVFSLLAITLLSSQAAWFWSGPRQKRPTLSSLFSSRHGHSLSDRDVSPPVLVPDGSCGDGDQAVENLLRYGPLLCGIRMFPFIFLYHGFIKSIPFELEEAAKLTDAAGFRPSISSFLPS